MSVQVRSLSHHRRIMGAATYLDRVRATAPVAYWPLNEASGSAAINYGTLGAPANGTYTGVTLANAPGPDRLTMAPLFDGANDYVDIKTGALETVWSMGGAEWSIMAWWKVYNAAVWTDGTLRMILNAYDTANNAEQIVRGTVPNQFYDSYWVAGAVTQSNVTSAGPTDWVCTVATRSETADELKYYRNGAWLATDTTIGTWAASAPWDKILIGAGQSTPVQVWYGWIAHVAAWDRALPPEAVATLAAV